MHHPQSTRPQVFASAFARLARLPQFLCRSAAQDAATTQDRLRSSRADTPSQVPFVESSRHDLSMRSFTSSLSRNWAAVVQADPAKECRHIQRTLNLTSESIQRLFAHRLPLKKFIGRLQLIKGLCGLNELMAKAIIIEETVQVRAKDPRIGADATIGTTARSFGVTGKSRKWRASLPIDRLSDVDLVTGDVCTRNMLPEQDSGRHLAFRI